MWCYSYYPQLIYNAIYYLIVDEKTCTTSNLLGDNLPHDVLKQQLVKLRYTHWRNHWYHPKLHITFNVFLIWIPHGDDVPFTLYGMVWVHETRGGFFGDLVVLLYLEGNIITSQSQQQIYTYHKWRERQHGMDNLIHHV